MDTYKVMIVDDHPHARSGIREILNQDSRYNVVAEAMNGEEAIAAAQQHLPDLIIMDIHMKQMNGLEATRAIKLTCPETKIVIVTVSDEVTHLFEAIKNGAQGYLKKNINPTLWLDYLNAIMHDEAPLSKELAHQMLMEFMISRSDASNTSLEELTERERELLKLVAVGQTNREIAEQLHISENTVKNHLRNIMQKLHVANRVQLTNVAYKAGIVN